MTNEQNGLSGIENLTPFEYALAGVSPTSNQDSPSLTVIEQMRTLAAEVQDAPVTQARLQELMQGGAGTAKRNDRRALKRRRATADGGFVDITPAELTAQNRFAADDMTFAEAEPTSEQPAINLSDTAAADDLEDVYLDVTDPIQLDEDGVVADPSDGAYLGGASDTDLAPSAAAGLAEEDFERQFDAIQAAMLDEEPAEEPTFYDIPIDTDTSATEPDQFQEEPNAPAEALVDEESAVDDIAVLGVSGLVAAPLANEQLFAGGEGEVLDPADRFAGDHLFEPEEASFEAEPALRSEDQDPGTPVLVTAGGEGLLLDDEFDDARNPLAVAALTGAVPPPVVPERRFGGAFWALAGTAAAAAVLALGGLLWANSLNDGTTTESASAAEETNSDDASEVSVDGTSEASTEAGEDGEGSNTSALSEAGEGDDRPALAVDGQDTGSSTTLDPDTTTQTTSPADEGDGNDDVPGTTAAVVTETTATEETTAPSETTEPPTTQPVEPDETTTVPPITEPPTPDPLPTPIPAPVIGPSFIGDRVTLGSFEGPGVSGVRVRLFNDVDGNGVGEARLAIDDTDEGGFYGFDEFPAGCYLVEFSRLPSGLSLSADQATQAFCLAAGDQNGRFDAVALVDPPDNCIAEVSNNFSDRGVEVHENDFDRADSYTFYNQNGGVVFRTSGAPDDLDDNPYGDYEWFAQDNGFNQRNVYTVTAERFGVESAPISCQRQ